MGICGELGDVWEVYMGLSAVQCFLMVYRLVCCCVVYLTHLCIAFVSSNLCVAFIKFLSANIVL